MSRAFTLPLVGALLLIGLWAACRCLTPPPPALEEISLYGLAEVLPSPVFGTEDWPAWRGPRGDGISSATAPTAWSETEHVVWKSFIPGRGHSSPVVFGQQVFLTTADEAEQVQSILSCDKQTGQVLWSLPIHRGGFMPMHAKNSQASATPACDGERLYGAFLHRGALWVTATDLKGNLVWQTEAGPFQSEHGYGSSPVLYQSLVLVLGDNQGVSFLAALHRQTGQLIWRVKRPAGASYGTPIVAHIAGRAQLLVGGHNVVSGYDPGTGQLLWYCKGPSQVTANSLAFDRQFAFASGGYPEKEVVCIRADGVGDVTATHVVWRWQRGAAYVPSPLAYGGLLYLPQDDSGIVTCVQAESGKVMWKERCSGGLTASPVVAGGYLYLCSEEGKTCVLRAGARFQKVTTNHLDEGILASPAVSGGRIFLRTEHHLYCIGGPDRRSVLSALLTGP